MSIDAVIFDLGNVLAFHDNALLFREMTALFGVDPERFHAHVESGFWERVNKGRLPGDALRAALCERFGRDVPRADFERAWSCHFTVNDPMVRLAESLAGKAKRLLLSNTHDLHFGFLRPRIPVLDRFDGLVLSCEVGHMKPEPAIYQCALDVAGVAPASAVFFDDVEAYVQAARDAGMHAHVFRSTDEAREQLAALGVGSARPLDAD